MIRTEGCLALVAWSSRSKRIHSMTASSAFGSGSDTPLYSLAGADDESQRGFLGDFGGEKGKLTLSFSLAGVICPSAFLRVLI